MAEIQVDMTVNGRPVRRLAGTHMRLLDFLRDELNLTGAKEGCGAGECGTCSVFVDGVLIKSCLMPVAKAQGRTVETVEGLAKKGELSHLQRAFHKTGASQCGYCIPGMVMAATATLRANPDAGSEEIKERLGGNICRCTGYQKIFEAVELARDVMNGRLPVAALNPEEANGSYIGANVRRIDAPSKVTGALKYAGDMVMPGMLHMQVLRSPVPHARILDIDTSEAEAVPGVEAVVTHRDVPGKDGFGVFVDDQPIMAREKVRYIGEAIAAIAAVDLLTAKAALRKIKVTYEDLPAVFDPEEAVREGAPVLHDYAPNNLVYHVPIRKGDVEQGFAEADLIVEQTYSTQAVEHAYLEPEAGLGYVDHDGVVTIHSPSQNITHHRHMLARILALPINKVRMIMSPVGGGFGGKEDMIYQGMLALAAMKSRLPVRLVFTREESIISTAKRHPFRIQYRMGLKKDGRIVAVEIRSVADGGAYGMSTEGVMRKHAILAAGPYDIPNVKLDVYGIYTNNTPSGAFRSFGAIPGLTYTMALALMLPVTFGLDPATGIALLLGTYIGGMSGGSVSAILIGIPGTPSAAATVLDGYPLCKQGHAGLALGTAVVMAVFGGLFSLIVMILVSQPLASLAIGFGPAEIFALVLFGMSTICGLAEKSLIRGLVAGVLGLMFMIVGLDPVDAVPRMTFGSTELLQGIDLVVAMIALFAIPQVLDTFLHGAGGEAGVTGKVRATLPTFKQLRANLGLAVRCAGLGSVIGAIPGTGGPIAAFIAYDHARRFSKKRENFGKGELAGVVAPESAHNAVTGGAMIPLLTLGIPGDPATAVILGAFLIHGLTPGPMLFETNLAQVQTIYFGFILAYLVVLIAQLYGIRLFVRILRIPPQYLAVAIILMCGIGSYAIRNSIFDVYLMAGIGLFGYVLHRLRIPLAPVVLGLVLGVTLESSYRQALTLSGGDLGIFVGSVPAVLFLVLTVLVIGLEALSKLRRKPGRQVSSEQIPSEDEFPAAPARDDDAVGARPAGGTSHARHS